MFINLKDFLISDDLNYNVKEILTVTDRELLENYKLNENVEFSGKFFKAEKELLLNGNIAYTYSETCARCLEIFDNKVSAKVNAVIVNEVNNEAEDIEIQIKDGIIDLQELIKQVIYLSMPMKALCKEDCKGICQNCGINLNTGKCECSDNVIDPRFEKLKTLFKD